MKRLCYLVIFAFSASLAADDTENYPIALLYSQLSEEYLVSLSKQDYQKAYSMAAEQLGLDPSNTIAYLRMAIAARHLDLDRQKLRNDRSVMIGEANVCEVQVKNIANTLLSSPVSSDD